MKLTLLVSALAAPAAEASTSYAEHKGVQIFTVAPCHVVIEAVTAGAPELPGDAERFFYGTSGYFQRAGEWSATAGMAWGFILGYDTAKGGLHSDSQTTLERLKDECAITPERTAIDILDELHASKANASAPDQPDPKPRETDAPDPDH